MILEVNLRFPDAEHLIVTVPGEPPAAVDFRTPVTVKDRNAIRWYIEVYAAHYATEVDDAEARDIEKRLPEWGTALFQAAFHTPAARRLFKLFQSTRDRERLLAVSAELPSILSLPWELLRDPDAGYLFNEKPPISIRRGVTETTGTQRPVISGAFRPKPCLRLLFVTSRPRGVGFIDPRADSQAVLDAIEQHAPGRIEVEFLRPSTISALVDRLENRDLAPIDIIHFDGHGEFDAVGSLGDGTPNTGYLIFENSRGDKQYISPRFWRQRIGDCGVSMLVLSACQSAAIGVSMQGEGAEEPLGSVAYGLAASGTPAVLAMTHSVLIETTRQLFGKFYGQLAKGEGIGQALDDARAHLMDHPERHEVRRGTQWVRLSLQDWFVPTLYQTGPDIPLLDAHAEIAPLDRSGLARAVPRASNPDERISDCSELPDLKEPGFFGRQRELWDIEQWFGKGTRGINITGFGGQGKTYLAAEVGRWLDRIAMFECVVFVGYSGFRGSDAVGYAVATLSCALQESFTDATGAAAALRRVSTLVILDRLDSLAPAVLADVLTTAEGWSECGQSRVLMTSRTSKLGETKRYRALALAGLGEESAFDYFDALLKLPPAPQLAPPGRETLLRLFSKVDFHPMSIFLLAKRLKTRPVQEVEERLELLLVDGDASRSVPPAFHLALAMLDDESRQAFLRLGVMRGGAMELGLMLITQGQLRFIQAHFGIEMLGQVKIVEPSWIAMRDRLQAAGLIALEPVPGVSVPYVRFAPILPALLWSQLSQPERDLLTTKHRLWYYQLSGYLYDNDLRHPDEMRAITRRELPNLLHALWGALDAGEAWGMRFVTNVMHFLTLFGLHQEQATLQERIVASRENR